MKLTKDNIRAKPTEMSVIHPSGEVTPAKIMLVSSLSKQYKQADAKLTKALKGLSVTDLPEEESIRLFGELYASCIIGWNDELAEAIGEYSPENTMQLFTDTDIDWIGAQVAYFIRNTANFFRPVAPTLDPMGSASDKGSGESGTTEELHQVSENV